MTGSALKIIIYFISFIFKIMTRIGIIITILNLGEPLVNNCTLVAVCANISKVIRFHVSNNFRSSNGEIVNNQLNAMFSAA